MEHSETNNLAGIEYMGIPGASKECQDAVIRLLQFGDEITWAQILTHSNPHSNTHCLLLTVNVGDRIAVKSGFSSGYGGEGPTTFSYVLQLLDTHKAKIAECEVTKDLIERLDSSALTRSDIEMIDAAKPVRPSRWRDYILEKDWRRKDEETPWKEFPPIIPFSIVDSRITDLALSFRESPDESLLSGYRRLEDIVRKRTKINEHGSKLFSRAFQGDSPILTWEDKDDSMRIGKANLFAAAYQAYRNPRAHHELKHHAKEHLIEFLLLNHLYVLERQAHKAKRRTTRRPSTPDNRRNSPPSPSKSDKSAAR